MSCSDQNLDVVIELARHAQAIGAPQGFAGMDGNFRFRPDGTAERALAVIEVQRDAFRTISPAASRFDVPTQ